MRGLKFRGQDLINKKWVYGSLVIWPDGDSSILFSSTREDKESRTEMEEHYVFPDTVGQYTGLADKNGKEIYEGDVVKYYDDIEGELIDGLVIYHADTCSFCVVTPKREPVGLTAFWQFEIVGNIHDNPELYK